MAERTIDPGTVCLVGAGPGDPGLITMRGVDCLKRADVVVYDRLVHPDILKHAAKSAERVYVGKESAKHTMRQEDINSLLVNRALEGKTVCRLKGGDPFVFGRGGEEAQFCAEAGVPFEVIPGVTSAIAGPAYAGIPITHREAASSFSVVTGHEEPGKPESRIRWDHLALGTDSLVFLMGVENLPHIVDRLLSAGKPPETPIALIRWATWARQETLVSTLEEVTSQAAGFSAPAVIIVGDVVRLRETLRWFDNKPLFGKRILITRAREQASELAQILRGVGAEPLEFPLIRVEPLAQYNELDSALQRLQEYSWTVFTSANAVRAVFDRLRGMGRDARAFRACRIASIGPATSEALEAVSIRPDFIPSKSVAEAAAHEWPEKEMSGRRVLFPRAETAREVLPDSLRELGAQVDIVAAYRTAIDSEGAAEIRGSIQTGQIDAVTFTSSSTVSNFISSIQPLAPDQLPATMLVASIGPITSNTAREAGLRVDVEAKDHSIPGLVKALIDHYRSEYRDGA